MAEAKKLKIGILTFWWSNDNYGQLLQCYGLQKYLRDAGHEAFLIRYNPQNDYAKTPFVLKIYKALNPVKLCKFLGYKINQKKIAQEQKLFDRHFDDFRKNYIVQSEKIYTSYEQLKENPPEADIYIVGSDQVWNFSFYSDKVYKCKNVLHAYFLDFGKPSVKRMSYAASWSCADLSKDFIEEIAPLLKKFEYVSVREKNGIELCKKCGYDKAEFRCDPTLLNDASCYRNLYKNNVTAKQNKKYILVYRLSNPCDFDIASIYKWAAEKNLEVIYVTGNNFYDKYKKTFATIEDWLYLIDNAEYVITNSFHCCVFSLLFKKKFAVVPLSEKWAQMNSRLETLFNIFNIPSRWLKNKDDFSVLESSLEPSLTANTNFNIQEILNV